jgi:hypothetical protein
MSLKLQSRCFSAPADRNDGLRRAELVARFDNLKLEKLCFEFTRGDQQCTSVRLISITGECADGHFSLVIVAVNSQGEGSTRLTYQ